LSVACLGCHKTPRTNGAYSPVSAASSLDLSGEVPKARYCTSLCHKNMHHEINRLLLKCRFERRTWTSYWSNPLSLFDIEQASPSHLFAIRATNENYFDSSEPADPVSLLDQLRAITRGLTRPLLQVCPSYLRW